MNKILKSLNSSEFRDWYDELFNGDNDLSSYSGIRVLITLTNAKSIICDIIDIKWDSRDDASDEKTEIIVRISINKSVRIPLSDISGIMPVSIKQDRFIDNESKPVMGGAQKGLSLIDVVRDNILENVKEYKWFTKSHRVSYRIGTQRPLEWGDLVFSDDFPLYWDRRFIIEKTGLKISNVGVGFGGIGVSFERNKGLWREFKKLFKMRERSLKQPFESVPFLVSGYIDFFDYQDDKSRKKSSLEMEGGTWYSGVISKMNLKNNNLHDFDDWQFCFLRSDGFFLDKKLWENMNDKVYAVCQYVPNDLENEYGQRDGFFQVRAVSYFKDFPR